MILKLLDFSFPLYDFSESLAVLSFLVLELFTFLAACYLHFVHLCVEHGEFDPQFLGFLLLKVSHQFLVMVTTLLARVRCGLRVDDCLLQFFVFFVVGLFLLLRSARSFGLIFTRSMRVLFFLIGIELHHEWALTWIES